MNYSKAFQNISNVTLSNCSPRAIGETAAHSDWQEVSLKSVRNFQERVELVAKLASENSAVVLKTATGYGRARLFVKA